MKNNINSKFRSFSLFYLEDDERKKKLDDDPISRTVDYLGKRASGNAINDLIPTISIYPEIYPTNVEYFIKKEEHFWILLKDCTIVILNTYNKQILCVLIYEPYSEFFPLKIYRFKFKISNSNSLFSSLITKTEAPFHFINRAKFYKLNPLFVELAETRINRVNFRKFKSKTDEKSLMNMYLNAHKVEDSMKNIWLPRQKQKLIDNILVLNGTLCMLCASSETERCVGTVIDFKNIKICFLYLICSNCFNQVTEKSIFIKLLETIPKHARPFDPNKFEFPSNKKYFELIREKLNEEKIEFNSEVKKENLELHIYFKNDSHLIVSYKNMLDYAYVFQKKGKEIMKWDSRDDHNVSTGLDHFHSEKDKKFYNSKVKESYLIGNFLLDFYEIMNKIKKYIS